MARCYTRSSIKAKATGNGSSCRRFLLRSTCATVAIEDKTFWDNQGFDLRGIARAVVATLRGGAQQGGSGITQQVVKNVVLPPEERAGAKRTTSVKIKEVLLSTEITRRYEKEQVLEWYLNTNFYGNLAYGIEAAAKIYFGKSAKDLDLAEAAMLAPIPQSPKKNPFDRPGRMPRTARNWCST